MANSRKNKMIGVSEDVYSRINKLQEKLNTERVGTYTKSDVIQLAVELLEKKENEK